MGALKGSCSVRRFTVAGDPPADRNKIMRGIKAHAFVPINPGSDTEQMHGWAVMTDPEDLELSTANVFVGDCVTLGLRVDTLKPPAAVVRRLVAEKLKPLDRKPNKIEKDQAKEQVVKKLRERYHPTQRAVDVVWNVDQRRLLFWSLTKKMHELLVDVFTKSFGLELVPVGPSHLVGELAARHKKTLLPTPEMLAGFPGLPGRPMTEDANA